MAPAGSPATRPPAGLAATSAQEGGRRRRAAARWGRGWSPDDEQRRAAQALSRRGEVLAHLRADPGRDAVEDDGDDDAAGGRLGASTTAWRVYRGGRGDEHHRSAAASSWSASWRFSVTTESMSGAFSSASPGAGSGRGPQLELMVGALPGGGGRRAGREGHPRQAGRIRLFLVNQAASSGWWTSSGAAGGGPDGRGDGDQARPAWTCPRRWSRRRRRAGRLELSSVARDDVVAELVQHLGALGAGRGGAGDVERERQPVEDLAQPVQRREHRAGAVGARQQRHRRSAGTGTTTRGHRVLLRRGPRGRVGRQLLPERMSLTSSPPVRPRIHTNGIPRRSA